MRVLTSKQTEDEYGMSPELVDQLERDAAAGVLRGDPRGEVVRGRPFMFGEEMRQVGFKEPLKKVEAIDRRAHELGMKRSDYLRSLVDADLAHVAEAGSCDLGGPAPSVVKALRGKDAAAFQEKWFGRAVLDLRTEELENFDVARARLEEERYACLA